jgi:hypothetical protein
LIPDENGKLHLQADAPIRIEPFVLAPDEMATAQEVMAQGKIREVQPMPAGEQKTLLRLFPLKTATETLGVLCLRVEKGVSWFASEQALLETQGQPTEQAIFFWTFLDEAVMKLEYARLHGSTHSE